MQNNPISHSLHSDLNKLNNNSSYISMYVPSYQQVSNLSQSSLKNNFSTSSLTNQTAYIKYRQQANNKAVTTEPVNSAGYQYRNQISIGSNYHSNRIPYTSTQNNRFQYPKSTQKGVFKKKLPLNIYASDNNQPSVPFQNKLASSQISPPSYARFSNFRHNTQMKQTPAENSFKAHQNSHQNRYTFLNHKPYQYMTIKKVQNNYPSQTYLTNEGSNQSISNLNLNHLRATIGSPSQKQSLFYQKQRVEKLSLDKKSSDKSAQSVSGSSKNQNDPESQKSNPKTLRQTLKKQVGQLLQSKTGISSLKSIPSTQKNYSAQQLANKKCSTQQLGNKTQCASISQSSETYTEKMQELQKQLSVSRNFNDMLQAKLTKTQNINKQLRQKLQDLNKRFDHENRSAIKNQQFQEINTERLGLISQNKLLKIKIQQATLQKQYLNHIINSLNSSKQQNRKSVQVSKSLNEKHKQQIAALNNKLSQLNQGEKELLNQLRSKEQRNKQISEQLNDKSVKCDQMRLELSNCQKKLSDNILQLNMFKQQAQILLQKVRKQQKETEQATRRQFEQIQTSQKVNQQSIQLKKLQEKYLQIIKQKESLFELKIRNLEEKVKQVQAQKQTIKNQYQIQKIKQNEKLAFQPNQIQQKRIEETQKTQKQDKYWQSFINNQLVIEKQSQQDYQTLIRIPIRQQISGQQGLQNITRKLIALEDVLEIVVSQCLDLGLKLRKMQDFQNDHTLTSKHGTVGESKVSASSQENSKSALEQENIFFLQKQIIELKSELQRRNLILMEKQQQKLSLTQCIMQLNDQLNSNSLNSPSHNPNNSFDEQIKSMQKLDASMNQIQSQNSKKKIRKILQRDKDKIKNSRNSIMDRRSHEIQFNQQQQINHKKQGSMSKHKILQRSHKRMSSYKSVTNLQILGQLNSEKIIIQKNAQIDELKSQLQKLQRLNKLLQQQIDSKNNRQCIQSNGQFYQLVFQCYCEVIEIFNIEWQNDEMGQLSKPPHQDLLQAINGFTKRIQNLMQSLNNMQLQVCSLTDQNQNIKEEQNHILKKCQFMVSNAEAENDDLVNKMQAAYRKVQHAQVIIIMLQKMLRDSNEQICALNLKLLNEKRNPQEQDRRFEKQEEYSQQVENYHAIEKIVKQYQESQQNNQSLKIINKQEQYQQEQEQQMEQQDRDQTKEVQKQIIANEEFSFDNPLSPASGQTSYRTQKNTTIKKSYYSSNQKKIKK